jgi:parallel beta-helix repeat protein
MGGFTPEHISNKKSQMGKKGGKILSIAFAASVMLSILTIAPAPLSASSKTVYVDKNNTGFEDGTLAYPYNTIQEGIDAASPGDTVSVAPGEYVESIRLKEGVIVKGSGADVTLINGSGSGYWITVVAANDSKITGFTIKGGGHGIHAEGCRSLIIEGNVITHNIRGIYSYNSSAKIIRNKITQNDWEGIKIRYSPSVEIISNVITRNGYGVKIYEGSDSMVVNNTLSHNSILNFEIRFSSPTIINNIVANSPYGYFIDRASPKIIHNDNWNIGYWISAYPPVENETPPRAHPIVENNISVDPMFVNPAVGDYRLRADSPCIDAGTNGVLGLPDVDLDGNPRRFDGDGNGIAVIDLGAFEYPFNTSVGTDVEVVANENVSLTFSSITKSGITTAEMVEADTITPENVFNPVNFKLAPENTYYEIKTTAEYTGVIELAIAYVDSGLTDQEEKDLRLMQWDNTTGVWVDITTWIDTENNIIYGETTHLSLFAVVVLPPDITHPTTTHSLVGIRGGDGWWLGDVEVTLTATDDLSGVGSTRYRIGGEWEVYSRPFTISGEGIHLLQYYSIDLVGNEEPSKSVEVKIDTMPPTTTYELSGFQGDASWWVGGVTIVFSAADDTSVTTDVSGLKEIKYRVNGGEWVTYSVPFVIDKDGIHEVEYYSIDVAGNEEEVKSIEIKIDTLPPVTSHELSGVEGKAGWWVSEVAVTLSAVDDTSLTTDVSGVNFTRYRVDGGEWITYSVPFVIREDGIHVVEYYSVDVAGNEEEARPVEIKVDQTPPEITTLTATPDVLWPPNHRMVEVKITVVAEDKIDPNLTIELVSVVSSEPEKPEEDDKDEKPEKPEKPEDARGDGRTTDDIQDAETGTLDTSILLRAERAGGGAGRIYTLTYRATDEAGNSSGRSVSVTVPHDMRKKE